jgi:hypothetical protein
MDTLTIVADALVLTILGRILCALLRIVHRREQALARKPDPNRPAAPMPIRIDASFFDPPPRRHHGARHDGGGPDMSRRDICHISKVIPTTTR